MIFELKSEISIDISQTYANAPANNATTMKKIIDAFILNDVILSICQLKLFSRTSSLHLFPE